MKTTQIVHQSYSSKNTSVNSKKLPAVYNKIKWRSFSGQTVLDIGAGKYTQHIKDFLSYWGIHYVPFDPYNCSAEDNLYASCVHPDVVICSNVFNVIKEKEVIYDLYSMIASFNVPFFITIYEGDKSWVGRETKKDCYQRNETIDAYILTYLDKIKHGVITRERYFKYIL